MKRLIDIVAATAALLLLSPVLALVALLVRMKLGSPVLFKQQRPGRRTRRQCNHAYIGTGAMIRQGRPGTPLVIGRDGDGRGGDTERVAGRDGGGESGAGDARLMLV